MPNFKSSLNYRITAVLLLLAATAAVAQPVPSQLVDGLRWRLIGPFRGGRAVDAAGVPGDSTTFYFGGVNGGIWKTTDAGVVWVPIFDKQPVGSIGALAVAASDPKTIYAGTGESDIRSNLSSGNGVYKSTDAGATWTHVGLEETRQISRIVIDPKDANVVYVGALGHAYGPNDQRGVFKSVDGGLHWTHVLDLGAEIGISDLVIASASPQVLFAGVWNAHRPPWSTYAPLEGPGSGLYRSLDAGRTWSRLTGNGLPAGDWGRVGVDVTADGKRVYALLEARRSEREKSANAKAENEESNRSKSGLYRSDDGGKTWMLVNSDPRLTGRAWYFNRLTIDPNNPDVVYMPNVALYRSDDGGKTISIVRGAPGGDDYHQLWIDPKNSASMVLATDQGTTVSVNHGQTWSTWYNQPTAQMYHVTTDNQFPYVVYGAQQDSGAAAVPSRTDHGQITPRDWFLPGSSESGYLAVDPKDPNIIYLTSSYGGVDRFNRRTGFSQDVTPWPAFGFEGEIKDRKYRAPWTPVLVFSPLDPTALYLGTQYVMKTNDGGLRWEVISPDLTGVVSNSGEKKKATSPPGLDEAKHAGYGVVFTVAPSPVNRDLIWAGSDTGLIHVTRDGGKNWKDVTPPGLSAWSRISLIEASHFDPAVAYAAVDRARIEDQAPYIYRTRDFGISWQLISNGIGAHSFLRAVREDPKTKGLLFAGSELGVYVSFDDGDHWQTLQSNLPVTSIRDLAIHGDDLVVATHGRSFWILDNITPLRQALVAKNANGPWLYHPAEAVRIDNDSFPGTPLPPEEPTAENPPNGAVVDYFLPEDAHTVQIEFFDVGQTLVRKFSSSDPSPGKHPPLPVAERWFPKPELIGKSSGLHRFVWDLSWGSSGGPNADEESEYRNPRGPRAVPGTYRIRLTVDGKTQEQPLELVMDPRSPATVETLGQQSKLGRQIFSGTIEARRALAEMASVQKQLADLQEKASAAPAPIKVALGQAQSEINAILMGEDGASHTKASEGRGLQSAYTGLASALQVVESGDRAVPSQAIAVYDESSGEIKIRIAEWNHFKQTKLEVLNQQLRDARLGPIAIAEIEHQVEFLMTR